MNSDLLVFNATDPEYADLKGAVEVGEAVLLGERYLPDGTLRAAFRLAPQPPVRANRPRQNPSVRIGPEFFTTALRDYVDWEEKWWREALQNSVDAGARSILCAVERDGDNVRCSVADDGRGMSEEVLLDKFLVLGGSQKFEPGAHGGFGKAKELLILPWLDWQIDSGTVSVRGQGIDYEVRRGQPHVRGVVLSVTMPPDRQTSLAQAEAFIQKCHLPGIAFTLRSEAGDKPLRATLSAGKLLREFPGAELHLGKTPEGWFSNTRALVRTQGARGSLFMFEQYVGDGIPAGRVPIVEVTGRSVDLLTANRDGFREYRLQRSVQEFFVELAKDTSSALREKRGMIRKKYPGAGKFTSRVEAELRGLALRDNLTEATERLVLSPQQIRGLQDLLGGIAPPPETGGSGAYDVHIIETREHIYGDMPDEAPADAPKPREQNPLQLRAQPDLVPLLADVPFLGDHHAEAALRQLVWEPDFYLINEAEGFRIPRKFFPEQMAPRVLRLLKIWVEMCRFVLIQLGCSKTYGVGFHFSRDTRASCLQEESEDWLLLNPFVDAQLDGRIYQVTRKEDLSTLYALAVHEVTHLAADLRYHDEAFSSALTENFARTAHALPTGLRIARAIR